MKVLFLDIDGVCNSEETLRKSGGGIVGIDPYLAFLIGNMVDNLGLTVVLSSSWRHWGEGIENVKKHVCPIYDITPRGEYNKEEEAQGIHTMRGREIKKWLDKNSQMIHIEKYAIIDDDSDMLPEQLPNFFQTNFKTGVTPEIIKKITEHFTT